MRPGVSIVGAGRLGTALAFVLGSRGYSIEALVARRLTRAKKAWRTTGKDGLALSASQLDQLPASRIILIAAPDDAIESVAEQLAKSQKHLAKGRAVFHTSGALSSEVLRSLAAVGFQTGSLHPLVSVSGLPANIDDFSGVYFCIEGDSLARKVARALVRDLGGKSFSIEPVNKALYHAAAVMASGHMTALMSLAIEMIERGGLSEARARKILLPLVESAVENLSLMSPSKALTGTFARGDVETVRRHLAAMNDRSLSEALAAYALLGRRSLELTRGTRREPETRAIICKLLQAAEDRNLK